jgi:hypothetical protein
MPFCEITDSNMEKLHKLDNSAIIRIHSLSCHWCKVMTPEFKKFINNEKLKNIDVFDIETSYLSKINLPVIKTGMSKGVPQLYIINNKGEILKEFEGNMDRTEKNMLLFADDLIKKQDVLVSKPLKISNTNSTQKSTSRNTIRNMLRNTRRNTKNTKNTSRNTRNRIPLSIRSIIGRNTSRNTSRNTKNISSNTSSNTISNTSSNTSSNRIPLSARIKIKKYMKKKMGRRNMSDIINRLISTKPSNIKNIRKIKNTRKKTPWKI